MRSCSLYARNDNRSGTQSRHRAIVRCATIRSTQSRVQQNRSDNTTTSTSTIQYCIAVICVRDLSHRMCVYLCEKMLAVCACACGSRVLPIASSVAFFVQTCIHGSGIAMEMPRSYDRCLNHSLSLSPALAVAEWRPRVTLSQKTPKPIRANTHTHTHLRACASCGAHVIWCGVT